SPYDLMTFMYIMFLYFLLLFFFFFNKTLTILISSLSLHDALPILCQCYGKRMMVMALPFLFGMILDLFKPGIGTGLAWLVWFVLFILLLVKRAKLEK